MAPVGVGPDAAGMGDAGAAALARALGGAPALQKLVVGNAFGAGAAAPLKAACAGRRVRAMKSFFDPLERAMDAAVIQGGWT